MFLIMIALGLFAALSTFIFLLKKSNIDKQVISFYYTVAIISIIIGFIFAFLFQALYNYIEYLKTGKDFAWKGVTFFGGLIGGVAAFVTIPFLLGSDADKKCFFKAVNCAMPSTVIAHALGRIGCFCAGCCYGIKNEKFGLKFPHHIDKVIPTNLYEAIFLFLLFAALILLFFRFNKRNVLIIVYAYAYSIFRFIIEFFRGDSRGEFLPFFSPSQWQAIFLNIFAIIMTFMYIKKNLKSHAINNTQKGHES